MRKLRGNDGYILTGLRIGTVLFGGFLKAQQRITRPATSRRAKGVVNGSVLTRDGVVVELEAETRRMQMDEEAKSARKAQIEAKRLADAQQASAEDGSAPGRGIGGGRGGRGPGIRGEGGGMWSSRTATTTSWSQGPSADGSGPTLGSLPFPVVTPHGRTGVASPGDGDTSAPFVALASNLSSAVSGWMSPLAARADAWT